MLIPIEKQFSSTSITPLIRINQTTHPYLVPFLFGSLRIKDYLCIAKQKEEYDGYKI